MKLEVLRKSEYSKEDVVNRTPDESETGRGAVHTTVVSPDPQSAPEGATVVPASQTPCEDTPDHSSSREIQGAEPKGLPKQSLDGGDVKRKSPSTPPPRSSTLPPVLPCVLASKTRGTRHSLSHDLKLSSNPIKSSRSHDQKLTNLVGPAKPYNPRLSSLIGEPKSLEQHTASAKDIPLSTSNSPLNFDGYSFVKSFKDRFRYRQKLQLLNQSRSRDLSEASESSFEDFKSFTDSRNTLNQSLDSCVFYSCSEISEVRGHSCTDSSCFVSASESLSSNQYGVKSCNHVSGCARRTCDESDTEPRPLVRAETEPKNIHTSESQFDSFHTALNETLPRLYKFPADSNQESFVTLSEYQGSSGKFARLVRAKEALIKGCDFVKSKFDYYRHRIPAVRRNIAGGSNSERKAARRCNDTCGFSCIHVGKEISQYSLGAVECQEAIKVDNEQTTDLKGDNSTNTLEDSSSSFPSVVPKLCFEQYLIDDKYRVPPLGEDMANVTGVDPDTAPHQSGRSSPSRTGEQTTPAPEQTETDLGHQVLPSSTCNTDSGNQEQNNNTTPTTNNMTIIDKGGTSGTVKLTSGDGHVTPDAAERRDLMNGVQTESNGDPVSMESDPVSHGNMIERLTSEDGFPAEDDLPIGMEANTMEMSYTGRDSPLTELPAPTNKRVQWLSALDKTKGSSFHSSTTSNSRMLETVVSAMHERNKREGVEQLLQEREMDPETMLKNLGFGCSPDSDVSYNRIPDRFLTAPATTGGIDLYQFVLEHPDLHHFLPVWHKPGQVQQKQPSQANVARSPASTKGNMDPGYQNFLDNYFNPGGWSRAHSLSSVVHGMRFLKSVQSERNPMEAIPDDATVDTPDEPDLSKLNSVLDYTNRKALAQQGFYGKQFMVRTKSKGSSEDQQLDAAQKRKQFQRSGKSRNWSLTGAGPEDENAPGDPDSPPMHSVDSGLMLRSFSLGMSSDSSLESCDNEELTSSSISEIRRQYHETIRRQSMDGEHPDSMTSTDSKISDIRKDQVQRLMTSLDDDGDYFAHSRQSSMKENDPLKRSQCSTLTGSPMSPKMFEFESPTEVNRDSEHFQYTGELSSPKRPPSKLLHGDTGNTISIIVEDESGTENQEPVTQASPLSARDQGNLNPNELQLLQPLAARSDSCHTLVEQDSLPLLDNESVDLSSHSGNASPCFIDNKSIVGDALSESTGSSGTINTMVTMEESDHHDNKRSGSPDQEIYTGRSKPQQGKEAFPPQESFELEEVSSAENAPDEIHYSSPSHRVRGTMEKCASTHSDSSGFADSDQSGDGTGTLFNVDNQQDLLMFDGSGLVHPEHNVHTKSPTGSKYHRHGNRIPHKSISSGPSQQQLQQKEKLTSSEAPQLQHANNSTTSPSVQKPFVSQSGNEHLSAGARSEQSLYVTSISYQKNNSRPSSGKSVQYTVELPLEARPLKGSDGQGQAREATPAKADDRKGSRFVSTVHINVTQSDTESNNNKGPVFEVKGSVQHQELRKTVPGNKDRQAVKSSNLTVTGSGSASSRVTPQEPRHYTSQGDVDMTNFANDSAALKHDVLRKKRSKEALITAKSQTADWLLSNQRQKKIEASDHPDLHRMSKFDPRSVSTPTLNKQDMTREDTRRGYSRPVPDWSLRDRHGGVLQTRTNPVHLQQNSSFSLTDESGHLPQSSLFGSSLSLHEEHLDYLKLARLVNAPSSVLSVGSNNRMSLIRYKPIVHMKRWHELDKQKHLEEEIRLMQHALQKYKVELTVMETMLFNSYQLAGDQLLHEERADVEELQCVWAEVRKEVLEMEQLLSNRLSCVLAGNDNFTPLNSLSVVQNMIDLLREQLYQQQMSLSRDVNYDNDDEFLYLVSPTGPTPRSSTQSLTPSRHWWSDLSNQVSDVRYTVAQSQLQNKRELEKSFSELREHLLDEVKGELHGSTQWLQLQLQSKDNEIQRLKMENFMQNIHVGSTRRKQIFESDV